MARCPLCETRYQPSLAKVIAERDEAYLLHIPCVKCKSAVVAAVYPNPFGVNSVGVLTDLTPDEVLAAEERPLEADDVLELYQLFRHGSGAELTK